MAIDSNGMIKLNRELCQIVNNTKECKSWSANKYGQSRMTMWKGNWLVWKAKKKRTKYKEIN